MGSIRATRAGGASAHEMLANTRERSTSAHKYEYARTHANSSTRPCTYGWGRALVTT